MSRLYSESVCHVDWFEIDELVFPGDGDVFWRLQSGLVIFVNDVKKEKKDQRVCDAVFFENCLEKIFRINI